MVNQSRGSFLKHFLIIGSGTVINMFIGLVTTPIITRLVDPVEYGQLSIFTMYAGIAEMILCLGLDQALVRFYYESDEIEYKRCLLFKCVLLPVLTTVGISTLFLVLVYNDIIHFEFDNVIAILLCICVLLQVIYRFSILLLRLDYDSKKYSLFSIIRKAAYLIFAVGLIFLVNKCYFLLLVTATIASIALCVVLSINSNKRIWSFKKDDWTKQLVPNSELLKYSMPFIISMGVTQIFQALDKISLNMYRSYAEVGVYSSTMTLVHIFAIIQTTFNALWSPMQVEHYTKNPEDHTFYQLANQIITVVMFFIGLSLILVKDVFAYLLGSKYREAAFILPFLIFNPIMYTISETTVGGLVFKKKSNMEVLVALGACITNFIGNTILVPRIGCQGAAISTGISYIIFFTLRTCLGNIYYYTDFRLKEFYTLTIATCILAFYASFHRTDTILVGGYCACIVLLIVLYRKTVKWGGDYLIKNSKTIISKYFNH